MDQPCPNCAAMQERMKFAEAEAKALADAADIYAVRIEMLEGQFARAVEALHQISDGDFASTEGLGSPFGRAVRRRALEALGLALGGQ